MILLPRTVRESGQAQTERFISQALRTWLNSTGADESRILNLGSLTWRKQRLHRPPRERNHLVCYSRAWQRFVTAMNSSEDMLREGKRLDNTSNQQFPGSGVCFLSWPCGFELNTQGYEFYITSIVQHFLPVFFSWQGNLCCFLKWLWQLN